VIRLVERRPGVAWLAALALWVGLVSYGIYLYHQPVYQLQRDWGIEDLVTSRPWLPWPSRSALLWR
jgi:peptidoglycan/LPS O-acetylase OafA/YrhL